MPVYTVHLLKFGLGLVTPVTSYRLPAKKWTLNNTRLVFQIDNQKQIHFTNSQVDGGVAAVATKNKF
jgi:hypothetical protein